jgi:hypothetical protein
VLDFVEKQRSSRCLLEGAAAVSVRARESPGDVPE